MELLDKRLVILLSAGLMAIYGAYTDLAGVKRLRKRRQIPDELMHWEEQPSGLQGADLMGCLSLAVHRLAVVVIGLLGLLAALQDTATATEAFTPGTAPVVVADFVTYCAAGLTGFFGGFMAFGPIVERLAGNRHCAVTSEGIVVAGYIFPWDTFSHFELETRRSRIWIWSRRQPGTAAIVAEPARPEEAARLANILREHVAPAPPPDTKLRRWAFPLLMTLCCLPFVAAGWGLSLAPGALSLTATALLMWLLVRLGGELMMRQIYGGKGRPVGSAASPARQG